MRNVLTRSRTIWRAHRTGKKLLVLTGGAAIWTDARTVLSTLPAEEIREDEHKSFRRRKYGKPELPLPPFLDPVVHKDRLQYQQLKNQEWHVETPETGLRAELAANPYAAVLSTPLRFCMLSSARLPRAMLQRFVLVRTPEAAKPMSLRPWQASEAPIKLEKLGGSTYALNDPVVIKFGTQRLSWQRLLDVKAQDLCARVLNRSPRSFNPKESVSWDRQTVELLTRKLWNDARAELRKLELSHGSLVLSEHEAQQRSEVIAAYFHFVDGPDTIGHIHNRPLFRLSCPEGVTGADTGIKGIVCDQMSHAATTALIRLKLWYNGEAVKDALNSSKLTVSPAASSEEAKQDGGD